MTDVRSLVYRANIRLDALPFARALLGRCAAISTGAPDLEAVQATDRKPWDAGALLVMPFAYNSFRSRSRASCSFSRLVAYDMRR